MLFFETFVVIFTVVYILLSKTVYDSAMNTKDNLRKNGKSWLYIFLLAEFVHLIVTLILSLPIYVIMLIIRLLL